MSPVAGFAKEIRIDFSRAGGRPLIVSHFRSKNPAEAPQRFTNVHFDVLFLAGPQSPQRSDADGLGGQADRGHRAEPKSAGNNRIPAVESDLATAVRGRYPDVFQYVIDAPCRSIFELRSGFAELRLNVR